MTWMPPLGRPALWMAACAVLLAACAPRLSPPYRDYEVRAAPASAASDTSVTARLEAAVVEAGWTLAPAPDDAIVSTEAQRVGTGLFSTTTAALDLIPLDGGFVRVLVRGESRSLLGGRTKVFTLNGSLRRAVLRPLGEALATRGFVALGTPRDRDEDATDG